MTRRRPLHLLILSLFMASFALRVLVPAGLMPTSMADGWFLQICPDGVSAEWMAGLNGDHHHHHDSMDQSGGESRPLESCELGAGLGAALANAAFVDPSIPILVSQSHATSIVAEFGASPFYASGARAPPHLWFDRTS